MKRFILLSFVFIGWAFYEFSGGSDFTPEPPKRLDRYADETPALAKVADTKAEDTQQSETVARAATSVPTTFAKRSPSSTQVTPVALTTSGNPKLLSAPFANTSENAFFKPVESANVSMKATTPSGTPTLAGLAQPDPKQDLRKVRASRINMRNGPGTQYNVLSKLKQGQEVVVLQSPGSGWVKLRVVESGRIGWVAEKLLEASS